MVTFSLEDEDSIFKSLWKLWSERRDKNDKEEKTQEIDPDFCEPKKPQNPQK